jgi:hypothetical protein
MEMPNFRSFETGHLEMERRLMKFNWKLVVAVVVMVGVVIWAVQSLLPSSYDGKTLNAGVGSGVVTVDNPSDAPVAVQLVGNGTRSFTVASSIEGVSGSSTRQGSGSTSTQLFEFSVPPGTSTFTVTRGSSVNLVTNSDTALRVNTQPLSEGESRTTYIVTAVILIAGLFYISRSTGHQWLKSLRRQEIPVPVVAAAIPLVETPVGDANRGRDGRMYSNYGGKD